MRSINIDGLSISFPRKKLFEGFSFSLAFGARVALIGDNGSGKSSLLKAFISDSYSDSVIGIDAYTIGYVPQIIDDSPHKSGAERFMEHLFSELSKAPSLLLLDEPTNHLDMNNRNVLYDVLDSFQGTVIFISHDIDLIRHYGDIIWHIDNGQVAATRAGYDSYIYSRQEELIALTTEKEQLKRDITLLHKSLMREQGRAKRSKQKGQKSISQNKWPTIVSNARAKRAEKTTGRKRSELSSRREDINARISELEQEKEIKPRFHFNSKMSKGNIVTIRDANISYGDTMVVSNINLIVTGGDRVVINGANGSGKTTLLKSIISASDLSITGDVLVPDNKDIGYIDQHYSNLNSNITVMETIEGANPSLSASEVSRLLVDFLFQGDSFNQIVGTLSGGERARLSLCKVAANVPKLLMLDEITNNVDLKTYENIVQVLSNYPGTIIMVSHNRDFIESIGVDIRVCISNGGLYFT